MTRTLRAIILLIAFLLGNVLAARAGGPRPGFIGAVCHRTTNQTINYNTWTDLNCDSNDATDGVFTVHDTVTNNNRLNSKVAGKWLIWGTTQWASGAGNARSATITKTAGGVVIDVHTTQQFTSANGNRSVIADVLSMTSSDYATVEVYQDRTSTGTLDTIANTQYMGAVYLGQ